MHARMRAERGLFWYDSLYWYDSLCNTLSTGLWGFGPLFGQIYRTGLSGKSTVPDFLSPVYRYCPTGTVLFVCLFVCCTGTVQVPYYRYRTGTVQVGECVSGVPPGGEGPL
jgi:hypothetical protein